MSQHDELRQRINRAFDHHQKRVDAIYEELELRCQEEMDRATELIPYILLFWAAVFFGLAVGIWYAL